MFPFFQMEKLSHGVMCVKSSVHLGLVIAMCASRVYLSEIIIVCGKYCFVLFHWFLWKLQFFALNNFIETRVTVLYTFLLLLNIFLGCELTSMPYRSTSCFVPCNSDSLWKLWWPFVFDELIRSVFQIFFSKWLQSSIKLIFGKYKSSTDQVYIVFPLSWLLHKWRPLKILKK